MFLSKIWIFLLAIVAAVALTLALLMPRPAERATLTSEKSRLMRTCGIADILLRDSARSRIQLASEFSRAANLDDALAAASRGDIVSGEAHTTAKTLLASLKVRGSESLARRVDVALLDRRGRVVARSGERAQDYGDTLAGYFLVDDALDGYLRDDLWSDGGSLFMVAGSPVVSRQFEWAGAVVVREHIDKDLTDELAKQLDADINFYVGDEAVATSNPVAIHKEILARFAALPAPVAGTSDCAATEPFTVDAGDKSYWVQLARLPGEAGQVGAFYAVFAEREREIGFMGTIKAVKKDDLSFGTFPWLKVGGLLLVMVLVGIGLTILEADRPLRRLGHDAVNLAKGDSERLDEVKHRGKFGSIARSVNIAIDKVQREARAAKKDLDNLLGPAPEGGLGGPSPLPASGPRGEPATPFVAPPPSEFKFTGKPQAVADDFDVGMLAPPPPAPAAAPLPVVAQAPTHSRVAPAPVTLPPGKKPPLPSAGNTPRPRIATPVAVPPMGEVTTMAPPDGELLAASRKPAGFSIEDGATEEEETRVTPGIGVDLDQDRDASYFREVFTEFVALKKQCGESIDSLTYAKFSRKLANNRDALVEKHGCKTVKFQVYVKDGKAALKASPVRG